MRERVESMLFLLGLLCALVLLYLWLVPVFTNSPPADVPIVQLVENEDDPGWDCRTMGNKVCGL